VLLWLRVALALCCLRAAAGMLLRLCAAAGLLLLHMTLAVLLRLCSALVVLLWLRAAAAVLLLLCRLLWLLGGGAAAACARLRFTLGLAICSALPRLTHGCIQALWQVRMQFCTDSTLCFGLAYSFQQLVAQAKVLSHHEDSPWRNPLLRGASKRQQQSTNSYSRKYWLSTRRLSYLPPRLC
jgi:hypothetical protein